VSPEELTGFMARVEPFFKEERVVLIAQRLNVHPGIVVGNLQRWLRR
jgi:HTH-type transcriptional regulator/antitoxin HigA